jgi:hypothetical protein
MNRRQVLFLLTGLTSGILMAAIGYEWSGFLAIGVGLCFFLAVLAAIAITKSWSHLNRNSWRIPVGFCVSTGAYVLAFLTFVGVGGYWADWLRVPLATATRFATDLWVGLLAASLIAATGVEFLVYVLIGKWSNFFLLCLSVAGCVTVLGTFLASLVLVIRQYWSFMGVLLPVGNALFCWLVGVQIWRSTEQPIRA